MLKIDRDVTTPLHLQLAQILREDICSGRIRPGDKLMSESEMVKRYGIARLTVREALNHLVNEGLVEKQHGRGSFCKQAVVAKSIDVLLDMSESYFVPYYMQSISAVLEANHANLIAGDTKNDNEEILRKLHMILKRGTDGVILQGCPKRNMDLTALSAVLDQFSRAKIPVMIIDYDYCVPEACCAVMDERMVGKLAAQYFITNGHRNTAAVCIPGDGLSEERFFGFQREIKQCIRIDVQADLKELLVDAVQKGITGLFCYNDTVAKQCLDLLQDCGFSVPEDVSIISVDDTMLARFCNLTSVVHPKQLLGRYAAEEILRSIHPKGQVFEPVLAERTSVKKLKI